MKSVTVWIALPLLLQLTACSMLDSFSHQSANTGNDSKIKALAVPPDLTHPQQSETYRIPTLQATTASSATAAVAPVAVTPAAAPASTTNSDLENSFQNRLQMLDKLKAEGLISDDEYRNKRQAIIKQL